MARQMKLDTIFFETARAAAAYSERFSADPMPRALLVAHTSWRVLS